MSALDHTDDKIDKLKPPSESLTGALHPLAVPQADALKSSAVEIISGAAGDQQKPIDKLAAGDHTIQLKDGRQFLVHVPETVSKGPLPVMFVFSGSGEPQWNIKDFAPESGMNKVADQDPSRPFVVVYPLPQKHLLGTGSSQAAFGWNSRGSLIDEQDRKNAGYDDVDYVSSIVDLMPQLANVRKDHNDWGAVGFSQGGVFLNNLISEVPHLFPSVDFVGAAMDKGYKYNIKPGNAQDVSIVELLGDKSTLPMGGLLNGDLQYHEENIGRFFLHDLKIFGFNGKNKIESKDPLAAIHNEDEVPQLQNKVYLKRLGHAGKDYTTNKLNLPTPVESSDKDFEITYKPTDAKDVRSVTVFGLTEAQHSYPAPLYGPRTNATKKYTEFDTSSEFAKLFESYNDRMHAEHQNDEVAGE